MVAHRPRPRDPARLRRRRRPGRRLQRADRRCAVRRAHPARIVAPARRRHSADHVGLAVAVASPVTHEATPLDWPDPQLSYLLTAFALLLSPLALGVGLAFNRIMALARPAKTIKSWLLIPAIAAAGLFIGICSMWWPELPGNGKSILTVSLNSGLTLSAAVVILFLKPLLTAVFLRAGAVGGMLTPALATGAAMGSVVALSINTWTELAVSVPAVSLTCAAGVLAITQRAPVWAAIFVWELARPPWWLLAPFLVAAVVAHGIRVLAGRHREHMPATG